MNKITSKIYTLINPRKLVLSEEIIDPKTIEKDEIIAQTIYSAISPGTELAAYCGIEPLRKNIITYPRLLGYCNVAKIIHLGEESEKWHVGDYILTFQSHRTHFRCRLSDFMIKLNPSFLKESTVSYLYHLGFHSVHTAELKIGHNAAIIGMGVLGYTSATISKLAGGTTFIFTNQLEHIKLIQEKKMTYFPKNKESLKHINELTENIGIDIIINSSNNWDDWLLALEIINKGGTIVNLGFPGRGCNLPNFNPLSPNYLYQKNLTIKYLSPINVMGVPSDIQRFNRERNLKYIIRLIEKAQINPQEIISSEIEYSELENQYLKYESREKSILSTIIKW